MKPTKEEIHDRFTYHPPETAERRTLHGIVSERTEQLAQVLRIILPEGRGLSLALTALEEARMWANQGLACQPPGDATNARDTAALEDLHHDSGLPSI